MLDIERNPTLHGKSYLAALETCEFVPKFLVHDLLAEQATFMLSSDGSVGKSTISLNAMAAMSAGKPVWGALVVPRALRIYMVLGERTVLEPLRRLKKMRGYLDANPDNFWITDGFSGTCNLLLDAHTDDLIAQIRKDCPNGIDLLCIDPLYPMVAGALSEDRVGNLVTRQFSRIKRALNCALWINHHNVKLRIGENGREVRATNPFYGSVWLYNHITSQMAVSKESKSRTVLTNRKDNWGIMLQSIPLEYHAETDLITVAPDCDAMKKIDRVQLFLTTRASDGAVFTKSEIIKATDVSVPQLYRIMSEPPWCDRIKRSSPDGKPAEYVIIPEAKTASV